MKNKFAGKFIVLDGPDGCGKSTQAKMLAKWLASKNVKVEIFRDPGGTKIGEKIRKILLNPKHTAMDTRTELLLYMAARAQLWAEKIAPALKKGKCVILDRWLSSTCAYQGYAGGFGAEKIIKIADHCLKHVWPDITIVLDVDLKTSAKRLKHHLDRMEQKSAAYHKKVRKGFLMLAKKYKNFYVIDATKNIQTVHKKVLQAIGRI